MAQTTIDYNEVQRFCLRIHNLPVSHISDRVTIGYIATLLKEGFSIRTGRHGIRMINDTQARVYIAPLTKETEGKRNLDHFKANAVPVATVSILAEDVYGNVIRDYESIAKRYMAMWCRDANNLVEVN